MAACLVNVCVHCSEEITCGVLMSGTECVAGDRGGEGAGVDSTSCSRVCVSEGEGDGGGVGCGVEREEEEVAASKEA